MRVYAGRDPVTGRERRLTGTARSRRDAEKLLTRLLTQLDEQRQPITGATLGYLLDRWLETANLELTTRHTYEGYIKRNIRPTLGEVKLGKLTVDVLDRYYADLHRRGGVSGRPMAPGRSARSTSSSGRRSTWRFAGSGCPAIQPP